VSTKYYLLVPFLWIHTQPLGCYKYKQQTKPNVLEIYKHMNIEYTCNRPEIIRLWWIIWTPQVYYQSLVLLNVLGLIT
jgi:hypothetical protein